MAESPLYDIVIAGAGAVGCAIASSLTRQGLAVVLVEARTDVGAGTSKANTAIWHTGFDAKPGTLEAALVSRGHRLLEDGAQRWGWALERTGAVLVAWDEEQLARLPDIVSNAQRCGYDRITPLTADEVYRLEPHLGPGAVGGLLVPDEGLLDPWTIVITLATDAVVNGATLLRDTRITAVTRTDDTSRQQITVESSGLTTNLHTRWFINAAGLGSDVLDRAAGHEGFTITPRRGQLIVLDKLARGLLSHVILPVPTPTTKGVLVSPTVYGNVLVGPTAEDLTDRTATQTTHDGLHGLLARGHHIMPALADAEITATYAGLRAATEHVDYCYEVDPSDRYVRVGGIRSTGISACLAIAERVVDDLRERGVTMTPITGPVTVRSPALAESQVRPYADGERIAADPAYGEIVCLCERTTLGEIRDALSSPVPAVDLDGLRRRTRAIAGRCQGFHCGARVTALLEGR